VAWRNSIDYENMDRYFGRLLRSCRGSQPQREHGFGDGFKQPMLRVRSALISEAQEVLFRISIWCLRR